MNEKCIAAIALDNREYPSLEAKLQEAIRWLELAAKQGAQLAVLPELLNVYGGDGPANPKALALHESALEDWSAQMRPLLDAAAGLSLAVTVPVMVRENGAMVNCFYLISNRGQVLGRYSKMRPTPAELHQGARVGAPALMQWEGIAVGGAICFDTLFPEVFAQQADLGAQLFLVPSLWPGGSNLNFYALEHSTPVVLAYPAWSRIIDVTGQDIAAGGYRWETLRFGFGSPIVMARINFNRAVLYGAGNQDHMVAVQREYGRRVAIHFDQQNGLFVLESRCEELSVCDVMQRFGLIDRRSYLRAARELCQGATT